MGLSDRTCSQFSVEGLATTEDFEDFNEDGDNMVLVKCHERLPCLATVIRIRRLCSDCSVDLRLKKVLSVHLSNSDTTTAERLY